MTDTNVIKLARPGTFTDSLSEILRNGARALLTQAVETEVADFLGRYADLKTIDTGQKKRASTDRSGALSGRLIIRCSPAEIPCASRKIRCTFA